jgi:hypothetical protein
MTRTYILAATAALLVETDVPGQNLNNYGKATKAG